MQVVAPSYTKRKGLDPPSNMWAWLSFLVVSYDTRKSIFKSLFCISVHVNQELGQDVCSRKRCANTSHIRPEESVLSKTKIVLRDHILLACKPPLILVMTRAGTRATASLVGLAQSSKLTE